MMRDVEAVWQFINTVILWFALAIIVALVLVWLAIPVLWAWSIIRETLAPISEYFDKRRERDLLPAVEQRDQLAAPGKQFLVVKLDQLAETQVAEAIDAGTEAFLVVNLDQPAETPTGMDRDLDRRPPRDGGPQDKKPS